LPTVFRRNRLYQSGACPTATWKIFEARTSNYMSQPATAGAGLRDVAAAPSSICFIDGEQGILSYRGYNIHDLATHCNFEEVIYLLWYGKLPKQSEVDDLRAQLAANAAAPAELLSLMTAFPKDAVPMAALRTTLSALSFYDPDTGNNT